VKPDEIHSVAARALKAGWQVNVHAIGDRANRLTLDQFEMALKEVPRADHRFRVEHAQILHWDDIPRFAQLGVNPLDAGLPRDQRHVLGGKPDRTDPGAGSLCLEVAAELRRRDTQRLRLPGGIGQPLISFHSFVSRQDADNWPAAGWYPEQKTTREEALPQYDPVAGVRVVHGKGVGSITPGKFGDFTVLDQDIMTIPVEQILNTKVEMTVIGGKVVYRRETPRT